MEIKGPERPVVRDGICNGALGFNTQLIHNKKDEGLFQVIPVFQLLMTVISL